MRGVRLDHVTLRTTKLTETVAFYQRFLQLKPGWRPPLRVNGAWLYAQDGDYPILHLIETQDEALGKGMFDHFALRGVGLVDYVKALRAGGQSFEAKPVPETPFTQVHHYDPNGVKLEVTFEEKAESEQLTCPLPYPPQRS
jgi:catechol 2,3-dioxygenase-like lactoylglutathione lyase family enzyme